MFIKEYILVGFINATNLYNKSYFGLLLVIFDDDTYYVDEGSSPK